MALKQITFSSRLLFSNVQTLEPPKCAINQHSALNREFMYISYNVTCLCNVILCSNVCLLRIYIYYIPNKILYSVIIILSNHFLDHFR